MIYTISAKNFYHLKPSMGKTEKTAALIIIPILFTVSFMCCLFHFKEEPPSARSSGIELSYEECEISSQISDQYDEETLKEWDRALSKEREENAIARERMQLYAAASSSPHAARQAQSSIDELAMADRLLAQIMNSPLTTGEPDRDFDIRCDNADIRILSCPSKKKKGFSELRLFSRASSPLTFKATVVAGSAKKKGTYVLHPGKVGILQFKAPESEECSVDISTSDIPM